MSVYDGQTEYVLGHTHCAKRGGRGWPPMDACFFAFDTPLKALEAAFPKDSKALKHPRVLIKVGGCTLQLSTAELAPEQL